MHSTQTDETIFLKDRVWESIDEIWYALNDIQKNILWIMDKLKEYEEPAR